MCNVQSFDIDDDENEYWEMFCARLDALDQLWKLIDDCQSQYKSNANPKIVKVKGEDAKESEKGKS